MHAAHFSAGSKRGKYFAGVKQAPVIKGAFQALLLGEIRFRKHDRHEIALFNANPMFSGKNPADFHAKPQDVSPEFLGTGQLSPILAS